jgi:1-deoxy-D-xylulose-5-phosphate synthase
MSAIPIGKSRVLKSGNTIAILNFGTLVGHASEAAEKLGATLIDMRFVKPLDTQIIDELTGSHELLVTLEDGAIMGGAGSAVGEYMQSQGYTTRLLKLGLPDQFILQGTQQEMYQELGLDCAGIISKVETLGFKTLNQLKSVSR